MSTETEVPSGKRMHFLDNLRTFMIFLVVLNHAGIVYESSGFFAPFWLVDDPATNDVVGLVNVTLDIFVMPAIFFVSGFLALASLKRRSDWSFVTRRFKRLMVPWLIAVLTLMPIYKFIFLYSRGLPQEHWTTYFHFSNGILSQNWLWFLPVLFLFDAVFWGLARAGIRAPDVSLKVGVVSASAIGALYSLIFSITGRTGWTKTFLFDFQNEKLLVYFLVFLMGALCFRRRAFDAPPPRKKGWYIAAASTAWIPMNVYIIVLLTLLFRPGEYFVSLPVDLAVLWISFQLSLMMTLYLVVETFRFWFNREGTLGRVLNENSYGVYIIHVPIVGALAMLMLGAAIPSLVKYVILTLTAWAVSNGLVNMYRSLLKPRFLKHRVLEPAIS
jgi:peptidoglycan/LPS O-acetylase OafA/YrhL